MYKNFQYDFNRNIESYGLLVNGSIGPLECCFLGKRVVKKANECTTDLQGTSPIQVRFMHSLMDVLE